MKKLHRVIRISDKILPLASGILGLFLISMIFIPSILFSIDDQTGFIELFAQFRPWGITVITIYIIGVVLVASLTPIFRRNKPLKRLSSGLVNQLADISITILLMLPLAFMIHAIQPNLSECLMIKDGFRGIEEALTYEMAHPGILDSCMDLIMTLLFLGTYFLLASFQGLTKISLYSRYVEPLVDKWRK